MKIALVSTAFVSVPPRDYGGTELVISELVEGLARQGHEVTLFATGDSSSSARLEALYPEAQWPPDSLIEINHVTWALAHIAGEGGYDIIHVHGPDALAIGRRFLPELPLVYTLHHRRVDALSRFYQYFPEVWYVTISERQKELEVPLPHMATIHHGLDPAPFAGPTRAGDYVCFLGRLSDFKGPHVAIDAAERAGLEIRVAGRFHDDDDEPGFGRREIEPRLALPHVRHLGAIGVAEKVPLLQNARALLAPLAWEEPFGLVMIEAMLSGCPVVAFPRGSAPELVEEGVTGRLVSNADHMAATIRRGGPLDAFDRERCRARAVERFGRNRMVEAYEAHYRQAHEESGIHQARTTPIPVHPWTTIPGRLSPPA